MVRMQEFEIYDSKPLVEQVFNYLLTYVIDKKLEVGDKLPNEYELAEMLGVGRSTIREAVKLLVSRNIVEIRRGAGTFVSSKRGMVEDPLGLSMAKDREKLALDLVNVRLMLEPEIAAMAAKNATDEDIENLVRQCDKVESLIRAQKDHTQEDIKLHRYIAKCSKNQVVENLIPIINSSVFVFVNVTDSQLLEETIETHREIVDCIKRRDVEGAKYAMIMHLNHNRRVISKKYNAQ